MKSLWKVFMSKMEIMASHYNRKVSFLGLSSLKKKLNIFQGSTMCSFHVQASYTSKMCPINGCIEDGMEPDQEHLNVSNVDIR